jgi:hypothetical protein
MWMWYDESLLLDNDVAKSVKRMNDVGDDTVRTSRSGSNRGKKEDSYGTKNQVRENSQQFQGICGFGNMDSSSAGVYLNAMERSSKRTCICCLYFSPQVYGVDEADIVKSDGGTSSLALCMRCTYSCWIPKLAG